MIRGVNKRIIEILNPSDAYFEKVILFLNPRMNENDKLFSVHSEEYLSELQKNIEIKHRSATKIKLRVMTTLCFLFATSFATILFLFLEK